VTPAAPVAPAEPVHRGPKIAVWLLAAAWCGVLAGLVTVSANPVVVNRVQMLHADVVAQGVWIPGPPAELDVQRTWKGTLAVGRIGVHGALPEQTIAGEVIVPLSRRRDGQWQITGGVLSNPVQQADRDRLPEASEVRPLVYPATADVIRQIEALLPRGTPAAALGGP